VNGARFGIVASVLYANVSSIFEDRRERYAQPGVLRGTVGLAALAIVQTLRGLYFISFKRGRRFDGRATRFLPPIASGDRDFTRIRG
jgi:hypothetical protein